ncbi:MAG: hypothetical protein HOP30_11145 [Cyclobacteriaceae bacterium]|nr:hypothetical protein [Cyclobacteriaceae bacterium]
MTDFEKREAEYLPAIAKEYNLILKKKSKLSKANRDKMVALAEALVIKKKLKKDESTGNLVVYVPAKPEVILLTDQQYYSMENQNRDNPIVGYKSV